MRHPVPRWHWPILFLVCAFKVEAQTPKRVAFTATVAVGTQHPSYTTHPAPLLWGAGLGAEVALRRGIVGRVAAAHFRAATPTRNSLSVCIAPEPPWELGTNCYERNFAAWYGAFTAELILRPIWSGPVYGVGGVGWTVVSSRPYVWSVPPRAGLPGNRALYRFGGGTLLGRSPRAPRLELATTRFVDRIGTAKSMATLQLWIR